MIIIPLNSGCHQSLIPMVTMSPAVSGRCTRAPFMTCHSPTQAGYHLFIYSLAKWSGRMPHGWMATQLQFTYSAPIWPRRSSRRMAKLPITVSSCIAHISICHPSTIRDYRLGGKGNHGLRSQATEAVIGPCLSMNLALPLTQHGRRCGAGGGGGEWPRHACMHSILISMIREQNACRVLVPVMMN